MVQSICDIFFVIYNIVYFLPQSDGRWLLVDGQEGSTIGDIEAEVSTDGSDWEFDPTYNIYPTYASTSPPQIFENKILEARTNISQH